MALKLTAENKKAIKDLAQWLNVPAEQLLEKMIVNQIEYCMQVHQECFQNQTITPKYELAALLKLLE